MGKVPSPAISDDRDGVLRCDYLVVGAGTAGMSFIDTLLDRNPEATVILVDRNAEPGGHWVHAYPFVRLDQPSAFYGVNSVPLGRSRHPLLGFERIDVDDRATGREIVRYYGRVRKRFEATGRVRCFFDVDYEHDEGTGAHTIATGGGGGGGGSFRVECGKLVKVANDIRVPSMRSPLIPVHDDIHFVPVNEVPSCVRSGRYDNYVVFGNGKTGADAVVELLERGVDKSRITWVVSRDAWYLIRRPNHDPLDFRVFMKAHLDSEFVEEVFHSLEREEIIARMDPDGPLPDVFKGPAIDKRELDMLRSIDNVVRMGRAKAIDQGVVALDRGTLEFSVENTVLVDCMVNNFYGHRFDEDLEIFQPDRINLGPITSIANPSLSSAQIAFLECALDDDKSKNDRCYFLRGEFSEPTREGAIGALYMSMKSTNAIKEVEDGELFLLGSRTNTASLTHLSEGLLRDLWLLYGPSQVGKFGEMFIEKVESGGYKDIDHNFGAKLS